MVAVNFSRIVKGPAFPYTASADTAEWTPAAGAPSGWTQLASGLVSPEGVTITMEQDVTELRVADRMAPVEAFRQSQGASVSFSVYDLAPQTFKLYTGNTASNTALDFTQSSVVEKFSLLIVGQSPLDASKRCGWWFPRCYVQSIGEVVTSRAGPLQVTLTVRALYSQSRSAMMKYSVQS